MAQSFDATEHHITLCLRDEADRLVTQSKLSSKVAKGEILKYAILWLSISPDCMADN